MTFLIFNNILNGILLNIFNIIVLLLCNFIILNSILCFYMKNPVFSLICLIMNYLAGAILMILFGVQFFSFIFLLIYVGAISILLLFTLMLLNLKIIFYKNFSFYYYLFSFGLFFFLEIVFFLFKNNFYLFYFINLSTVDWFSIITLKNELDIFGLELFVYNKDLILLTALFLLVILIASINVVNAVKYSKKQILHIQLKRTDKIFKK